MSDEPHFIPDYIGPERRKAPFTRKQLSEIEKVVELKVKEALSPMIGELAELLPFIRAQKNAFDERAAFWAWMKAQAQHVASTNIRYAINAALWFALMVVILGVTGVWRKFWPWP